MGLPRDDHPTIVCAPIIGAVTQPLAAPPCPPQTAVATITCGGVDRRAIGTAPVEQQPLAVRGATRRSGGARRSVQPSRLLCRSRGHLRLCEKEAGQNSEGDNQHNRSGHFAASNVRSFPANRVRHLEG
jgi:hypothetical protein